MADPFSLAASVFATIQIADRLVGICKHYIESVQDAPSDLRVILVETSAVKTILENVEFLLKCDNGQSMFDGLSGGSGPIEGCRKAITDLLGLLPSKQHQKKVHGKSKRQCIQLTLETIAWPLKETKARKLLEDIARHKGTITFALTTDAAHGIRNIQKILTESQQKEIYKWLRDVDPSPIHHRACQNHEPGTCDWMSRLPEWPKFLDGKIRCLWIHGIPGAGKTILASQLITITEENCKRLDSADSKSISIYYYCYFGNNQNETSPFLKWVLVRLCRQAQLVPDLLWKLFQHGGQPSTESLLSALEAALERFEHVFITIDAIDESKPRDELLKVIRNLATDHRFAKVRLLATSREYLDIEKAMQDVSTEVSMRNAYLDADIRLYTESRLRNHEKIKNWPLELRNETLEALCAGAKGMFRWVVCQIDSLRRVKGTNTAIRRELRNLPTTLDNVYDRIFQSIPEEDAVVVRSAMRWICFNQKLFSPTIPSLTLLGAVENDVSGDYTCAREYQYDIDLLRELCGCLITVELQTIRKLDGQPGEQQHVSFAHYTVLEYLASPRRYQPNRFFAFDKDEMLVNQAELILEQAQFFSIADAGHFTNQDVDGRQYERVPNFPTYCALSALMLIDRHDSFLAEKHSLASLVISFEPEKAHFLDILHRFAGFKDEDPTTFIYGTTPTFYSVTWNALPDPQIRTLVQLLLSGALKLSHFLLQKSNAASILKADIHLEVDLDLYDIGPTEHSRTWHFHGSVVDFYAMHCIRNPTIFKYLIDSWAGAIDFRTVLVSYIPWHAHQRDCKDWCVVQKLLESGAPVDSQDYALTPLQVAVAFLDLEGVDALLRNGAMTSALGSTASGEAKYDHLGLSRFLGGKLPLEICVSGLHEEIMETLFENNGNSDDSEYFRDRVPDVESIRFLIQKQLVEHSEIGST
ncbi:uncharacterized protein LY79DRAFT_556154 [Colletotrichum navitas]|uniref:Nephrocystin 3-like N-terminal domain-containing protein n=1 Tax=Colletotrichum navitas TaxID=681940 RepID=A0AAD8PZF2_9PEZI|nr:uncharacterized protein LY79DRAFT_556154 [Colletotrichum navitas]KAK1589947.1 hypothetical protein LY79DRAFT_556154 [Colletotrichum navitas]